MSNINVTIELCAEDRARLDNILAALQKSPLERASDAVGKMGEAVKAMAANVSTPEPQEAETPEQPLLPVEEPKAEAPKKPAAKPEKKAAPESEVKEVTVAELQAKVVRLVNAGKKAETREIILKYAPNVGSIPEDKRAEVLELLNGLEG